MDKICINCKWCNLSNGEEYAECNYTKKTKDRVSGKPERQFLTFCNFLREGGIMDFIFSYAAGICGPQGRYFEEKSDKKGKR